MKKIIYAILGIFLMVACTDDHFEDIPTLPQEVTKGKVEVKISVQIPDAKAAASRSFSNPAITTLHLAVFDANGYLSEVVPATRADDETGLGTADEPIEFKVDLSQTPSKRIIHFLANETIDASQFGTEGDLIGALYTEGTDDAYWQRVEFPDGISYSWEDKNDNDILDADETIISNTIGDKLTKVPLIRNFAKITVQKAEGMTTSGNVGFTLQGFTVVNVPDRGSVAPFNTNGGGFAQYLDSKTPYDYSTLTTTTASFNGYTGFIPSDAVINSEIGAFLDPEGVFYTYERNNQSKNENRTFVIVKGKFGEEETSYYKIDLTYTNTETNKTEYYEILRNFHYNIVITNVEASGANSPEEAATMTGSHNNLSAATETQSLLNISDGAERLFVNHTEYVFVASGETMALKYRYVPSIDDPNTENNGVATYSWDVENQAVASITAIDAATDDAQGWRTLTVTAAEMDPNRNKQQTLTLVAGNLSRTVKFILRKKFDFSNEMATSPQTVSEASNKLKATFVYSFTIPENIPESLFPMTFIVQADPENIYPNADENSLPVQVLDGQQTFGYEREVTWEEYQQTGGIINCYFRVNTTSYANTQITVSNKYFNDCNAVTLNDNNSTYAFSNLVVNGGDAVPYGVGRSVTFTFNMPYVATGGTDVTITANKMSASRATTFIYKATTAGTQTVTFTTGEFASADRIKLEAAGYITAVKAYDNVLKIKAASVTGNTTPTLDNTSKIRVYASESDAKAYGDNHLAEVTRSTLTSTETTIALTGLSEESKLYFAYEGTTHIYVGEATASALAGSTANISLVGFEKPLKMSVVYGDGTQYYGTGKTFTLTFTTNKTGIYTLASDVLTFTSTDVSISNNQFEVKAAGTYTFTCTTTTWSDVASVTITKPNDNTSNSNSVTTTGVERLWFKFGEMTGGSNTPENNQNITVLSADGQTNYGIVKWSALKNGTAELKIEYIKDITNPENGNLCIFQYEITEWQNTGSGNRPNWEQVTTIWKTTVQTIPQAGGGTTLNFQKQ